MKYFIFTIKLASICLMTVGLTIVVTEIFRAFQ